MSLSASGKRIADMLPPLVVGVLVLAGWEACCRIFAIPVLSVPVAEPDRQDLRRRCARRCCMRSGSRLRVTLIALALAIGIGTAIAFLFVQSPIIERSFFPYAIILQVTPIVAIAPLIIILVKNTQGALIICATIIAIFPIISNTTVGLAQHRRGPPGPVRHQPRVAPAESRLSAHSRARCRSSSPACASPAASR